MPPFFVRGKIRFYGGDMIKNRQWLKTLAACLLVAAFFVQDTGALALSAPVLAATASEPQAADISASSALPAESEAAGSVISAPESETPVEEAPSEETPAEETPVEEIPAEETSVEELPAEEDPAKEAPGYRQVDAFANAVNVKGVQEMLLPEFGGQHTLLNVAINNYIDDEDPGTFDYCWPYEYNGNTFYMDLSGIEILMERLQALNKQSITVSMVFLVQYANGREFLIDDAARVRGFRYYAPATTGLGGEAFCAFFEFFMWRCSEWGVSVDNFILGNEINNPYSWHYSGAGDIYTVVGKYAAAFRNMYNIVRKYTDISRCSISLDHNWTHSDVGRQFPGRTMLDVFHATLEAQQPGIDWCISYHLYPAIMYNTAIWRGSGYNANSPNAMFIDGANLHVLTDYVRNTFGEQHRIMLTEQGFSIYDGNEYNQAVALAISYYAAKHDPMVDNFILYCETLSDARLNFSIEGRLAERVYEMLDSGDLAEQAEIEQLVLQVTGRTLGSMVPNYVSAEMLDVEPQYVFPEPGELEPAV